MVTGFLAWKGENSKIKKTWPFSPPHLCCTGEISPGQGFWLNIVSQGGDTALQGCHTSWHCWALALPRPDPAEQHQGAASTSWRPNPGTSWGWSGPQSISLLKLEVRIIYSHFNRTTAALYLEMSQEHWKNLDLNCRWMDFNLIQVAGLHDSAL